MAAKGRDNPFEQTMDEGPVHFGGNLEDPGALPCLVVLQGENRGKRFPLSAAEVTLGRSPDATFQIQDNRISRIHCRLGSNKESFWIEDCDSHNGTHVDGQQVIGRVPLKIGSVIRIGHVLLRLSFRHQAEVALEEELFQAATTDPLTRVPNRRWFEEQAEISISRSRRHNYPLSMLILDIDHFKTVNDTHGHACGDRVLAAVAGLLCEGKRQEDLLCRYGGEEFLMMLVDADPEGARQLAERLRQRVMIQRHPAENDALTVTISIGISFFRPEDTFETLVRRADNALYRAKEKGRNRVEQEGPEDVAPTKDLTGR